MRASGGLARRVRRAPNTSSGRDGGLPEATACSFTKIAPGRDVEKRRYVYANGEDISNVSWMALGLHAHRQLLYSRPVEQSSRCRCQVQISFGENKGGDINPNMPQHVHRIVPPLPVCDAVEPQCTQHQSKGVSTPRPPF